MVSIESSVKDELVSSVTENEDLIREELQRAALDDLEYSGSSISADQRREIFEEVDDELALLYDEADSIMDKLAETLDKYSSKIPFVNIESLEDLAKSLKKAAELGAFIGGGIALMPVLLPYMEYTDGAANGPVIGLIMGAVIGAMVVIFANVVSPLVASLLAASYAVGLCGFAFPDIQEKYFSEYKKAV